MRKKSRLLLSTLLLCMMVFVFPTQTYALNRNVNTDIIASNVSYIADYVDQYGYVNSNGYTIINHNSQGASGGVINELTQLHLMYVWEAEDLTNTYVDMYVSFPYDETYYSDIGIFMHYSDGSISNAVDASASVDPSDYEYQNNSIHFVIRNTTESNLVSQNWANTALDNAMSFWNELLNQKMGMSVVQLGFSNLCSHSWDNGVVSKEAACTSDGVKAYTCQWCGMIEYESIPATGHKYSNWVTTKEPTCTKAGSKEKTCSNCGDKIKETIEATGHDYDDWEVESEATIDSTGLKSRICDNCGYEQTKTIPKLKVKVGTTKTVSAGTVKVLSTSSKTVAFTKAKNKSSITVPATVKMGGKTYKVTQINAKAFKGSKIKTVTISKNVKVIKANAFNGSKATKLILKTKLLKKAKVKGCLKGSKIKTIQVKVGSGQNKKYVKKYKEFFTKANAGKKVTVK